MKICAYCGKELPDFALFCDDCGNRVAEAPAAETPMEDTSVQVPKKKRWVRTVVAIVSAVAVLFFTFSFIFNWFGLFSPMARVSRATMRTLKADSLTLSTAVKVNSNNYYSEQSTTLRMVVDEKAQELNRYTTSSYYSEMNEKISRSESVTATGNGRQYSYTTMDGTVTYGVIGEVDDEEYFDWREDLDDEIDWEDIVEDAELEDYIDADEAEDFVRVLNRKYFGNRRWLKKNAGYTKKGNTYTFRPDTETFLEALADIVDESDAVTRKGKREFEDGIDEWLDQLDEEGVKLDMEISFTIKGRYLSNLHIEYTMVVEGETTECEMDIDISDVNRTKISKSEVRSVKSTVNEYLEAEGITYDECDLCSDFGRLYTYSGRDLCWDCYDERKYG